MKIELRGVSKRYGRVQALDRVSVRIEPGQIVALLGPKGAGKTTLLRCLAGILGPDDGEVSFDNQPLRRDRLDLRRRYCYLPDSPFLFWDQTVIRNIGVYIKLYEADVNGVEDDVLKTLREFDMLSLAYTPIQQLSRSQAYKAALCCLVAVNPDIWLLDEPLACGIDAQGVHTFKKYAREAVEQGRTVIYSTQLLEQAETFSDRVCVISEGAVRAFDAVAALRESAGEKPAVLEELFEPVREERE